MARISEVLSRAADLIEKPGAWLQGCYAKDADGQVANEREEDAVAFCAAGAIVRAGDERDAAWSYLVRHITGDCNPKCGSVSQWNDRPERTQAEVVATMRRVAVIAAAEGL